MTTIVLDKLGIAFDSMLSYGDRVEPAVFPKVVMSDRMVFGCSGEMPAMAHLIREVVYKDREISEVAAEVKDDHDWTMLVVDRTMFLSGVLDIYSSNSPWPCRMQMPFAIGSGQDFAMGAIGAGAKPEAACKIACLHDINSGLTVHYQDFPSIMRLMRNAPANTILDVYGRPFPGSG